MLILSILFAGALSCAAYAYVSSFSRPAPDVFSADAYCRPTAAPQTYAENLIDLNTATLEQLDTLPGIGRKTAEAILAVRSELGRFRYKEELLLVSGIGEKKLDALYDLICVK